MTFVELVKKGMDVIKAQPTTQRPLLVSRYHYESGGYKQVFEACGYVEGREFVVIDPYERKMIKVLLVPFYICRHKRATTTTEVTP